MARRRTAWIIAAAVVVAVLAGIGVSMYWLATSEGALHWAIARLEAASGGRLRIESASGTLLGPVETVRITYVDAERTVRVERARIEVNRRLLLDGVLDVQSLRIDTMYVTSKDRDESPSPPHNLSLPLEVRVRRLDIGRVVVAQGTETITLAQIAGSYEGGAARHRLRLEPAQTPWGTASGDVALGARTPFELNGTLRFLAQALDRPLELDGTLNGTLLAPRAALDAKIGETRAHGEAVLAPFAQDWLHEARIEARGVDLAAFMEGAPRSDARIAVRASGGASGALQGHAEIVNANPGALSANLLPLASLETRFAFERGTLKLDALQASLGAAGRAHGAGEIEGARVRLSLAVEALDLRGIHADIRRTRLAGNLQLEAGETAQRIRLDLADARLKVSAKVRREGERLVAETLRAVAYGGELSGTGSLELGGKRAFAAQLKARGFDPARLGEFPRAVLNGTIDARGTLAPAWRAQVQATLAGSRFRGAPLEARARFEAAPGIVRALDADVRIGDNQVQATGSFGAPGQALDIAVNARRLAQLDPRIAGSLSGKARLEGSPRRFGGTFEVEGGNLAFEGQGRTLKLRASGSVPLDARKDFTLDLRASGVDLTQAKLESARAKLSGRLDAHDIVGEAKSPGFDAQFAANGGWSEKDGWRGRITRFVKTGEHRIELVGELPIHAAPGRVVLGAATLRALGGEVALQSFAWDKGRLASTGRIRAFPAAPLVALAGWQPERGSNLALDGDWSLEATPRLNGRARIERASGDLVLAGEPPLKAELSALAIEARVADDVIAISGAVRSARMGQAELQARIAPAPGAAPGVLSRTARLSGELNADAQSLGFLQQWAGGVAAFDGRARAQMKLAGTLGAPLATGSLALDGVRIDMPQHGLELREGQARIVLDERRVLVESLAMRGGDGLFRASGAITRDEQEATFEWHAERLRLLNRPDRQLVASGKGSASLKGRQIVLRGELKADRGVFVIDDAPGGRLGDDVVVEGRTEKTVGKARRTPPLDFDMTFDAGDSLRVRTSGLDTELRGKLRVHTRQEGELLAHGNVEMRGGSYRAFGQKLVIERGRLVFDGSVRNPGLDLLALRKNQAVEAGVEVRGTLQVPVTRLVSEPPVPDQEKLAWLLLGRSAATAQGAESALLQAALASIATSRSGAPLGQDVAQKLGLDEVGLRSGLGGHAVALGKRVANRIYIEYEQGLTIAATLVRLKVDLTRTLNARIEAGAQGGRIGIGYDISYD